MADEAVADAVLVVVLYGIKREETRWSSYSLRMEKLLGLRLDPTLRVMGSPRVGLFCQLREGDVILRVDGVPVSSQRDLEQTLRTVSKGQFLMFTARRGNKARLAKVVTLSFVGS